MFKLVTVEDTVIVAPYLFGHPREKALEHAINKRYSDRILPYHGICVALWDFTHVAEDRLVLSTGESSTVCVFRLVLFAPFAGEVMFSRVQASHESGLFAQVGFFEGIRVEKERLPKPSVWDEKEKVWIWKPVFEEGGEAQTFYMDVSNESVLRVVECEYGEKGVGMKINGALYDGVVEGNQGLGDPLWWYEEEVVEEGEEEDGDGYVEGDGNGDEIVEEEPGVDNDHSSGHVEEEYEEASDKGCDDVAHPNKEVVKE